MKKLLIVNSEMIKCGIHQYGWSLFNILSLSDKLDVSYLCGINGVVEAANRADYVIFNYHPVTLSWLNDDILGRIKSKKFIIGGHDYFPSFENYDHLINCDTTAQNTERSTSIGRPVFSRYNFHKIESATPIIGSFGFAFEWKNFEALVGICRDNFRHSTLRLSLPQHSFGSEGDKDIVRRVKELCRASHVQLEVNESFLSTSELIRFLSGNHINVFLYPEKFDMGYRGLSSAIDFALSAKRPIAISNSPMFRHIDHEDRIRLDKYPLKEIMKFGDEPIEQFLEQWNEQNLIHEIEQLLY